VVPHELKMRREHGSYAVLPLFFKAHKLGYLLLELGLHEAFAYEALRELFSAAVKGALLVREVTEVRDEHSLTLDAIADYSSNLEEVSRSLHQLCSNADAAAVKDELGRLRDIVASELSRVRRLNVK
jgi:hypothetical protein